MTHAHLVLVDITDMLAWSSHRSGEIVIQGTSAEFDLESVLTHVDDHHQVVDRVVNDTKVEEHIREARAAVRDRSRS